MIILSTKNAAELRRMIKETAGRDISAEDVQTIWHFIVKLVQVLHCDEIRRSSESQPPAPPSLFDTP